MGSPGLGLIWQLCQYISMNLVNELVEKPSVHKMYLAPGTQNMTAREFICEAQMRAVSRSGSKDSGVYSSVARSGRDHCDTFMSWETEESRRSGSSDDRGVFMSLGSRSESKSPEGAAARARPRGWSGHAWEVSW